jgi:hypothetical protein
VITGEIKSQVNKVWNTFWSGGISNPLEVIEQITCLLFLKRSPDQPPRRERQAQPGSALRLAVQRNSHRPARTSCSVMTES